MSATREAELEQSHADLLIALKDYMAAVEMMNAAMKDGGNAHGALSSLIGCEGNARAAIANAEKL
jgi:hypothetical protein